MDMRLSLGRRKVSNWLRFMILLPRRRCIGGSNLERYFLKEGDQNTKYFHMTTLKHKMTNKFFRLNTKEGMTENEETIKRKLWSFLVTCLKVNPI